MIAILLSTYNGERFLQEQLDSLFQQTRTDWVLFVRDDGSSDNTINILNSYIRDHKNIVFFSNDTINRGPGKSFLYLLEHVEADYYLFCDQDDVWFSNKVERSMSELIKLEAAHVRKPVLVFSDLSLVDSNLKAIHSSMWTYAALKNIMETKFLCCVNYVTGCTIAMNNLAKSCVLRYKEAELMHDTLSALAVSRHGVIHPISESLIFYRQHEKNTLGALSLKPSLFDRFIDIGNTFIDNISLHNKKSQVIEISLGKFLFLKLLSVIKRMKAMKK